MAKNHTKAAGTHVAEEAEAITDPVEAAKSAGLRYVHDSMPGIRRERRGEDFTYIGVAGKPVRDGQILQRIASLAIPPAWTDVWIAPTSRGHLQATGRDAKGRKQYRYHPRWREVRDETKYHHMIAFGEALPRIRERVAHDMALPGMPREKVLAAVVELLNDTFIRIGNETYARENKSFGLTTLRNRHVDVQGATLRFHFRGKSGKEHSVELHDRRMAQLIKHCKELPGYELFQYVDDEGERHTIESADVNDYLREISGLDITAKDFRTWAGTVIALDALEALGSFETQAQAKKNVAQAIKETAEQLGNTPTICRKCYVHPAIIDAYLDGTLLESTHRHEEAERVTAEHGLSEQEREVLALLRHLEQRTTAPRKAG